MRVMYSPMGLSPYISLYLTKALTIITVLINCWRSGNIDRGSCEVLYYIYRRSVAKTNKQSLCTNSLKTRRYTALSDQGNIQPWLIREPSGKHTALAYQGTIRKIYSPGLSGNHQENIQPCQIREPSGK